MKTTLLKNDLKLVTPDYENSISGIVCCDLLSLVMAVGTEGNVFVTVQNNLNSVAVASLHDFSTIILTYGQKASDEFIEKACENEIVVFETTLATADVVSLLNSKGIL